jgi:hypothetical protein
MEVSMHKRNIILLSAILVLFAATTVGFAHGHEGEKAEGEHKCWAKENPEKAAKIKDLAVKAEGGCEHSKAELIAMYKEGDCEEAKAMAVKAEGGCDKSMQAMITKSKNIGECKCGGKCEGKCEGKCKGEKKTVAHHGEKMDTVTLAAHAEKGCPNAKAELIAMAKEHGCEKGKALAAKAEGGCEKSMNELIAMAKEEKKAE